MHTSLLDTHIWYTVYDAHVIKGFWGESKHYVLHNTKLKISTKLPCNKTYKYRFLKTLQKHGLWCATAADYVTWKKHSEKAV